MLCGEIHFAWAFGPIHKTHHILMSVHTIPCGVICAHTQGSHTYTLQHNICEFGVSVMCMVWKSLWGSMAWACAGFSTVGGWIQWRRNLKNLGGGGSDEKWGWGGLSSIKLISFDLFVRLGEFAFPPFFLYFFSYFQVLLDDQYEQGSLRGDV